MNWEVKYQYAAEPPALFIAENLNRIEAKQAARMIEQEIVKRDGFLRGEVRTLVIQPQGKAA